MMHQDEDALMEGLIRSECDELKDKLIGLGGCLSQSLTRSEQILLLVSSVTERLKEQEKTIEELRWRLSKYEPSENEKA